MHVDPFIIGFQKYRIQDFKINCTSLSLHPGPSMIHGSIYGDAMEMLFGKVSSE